MNPNEEMTVKDMITKLLEHDMNSKVSIAVDYDKEQQEKTGCVGAEFPILAVRRFSRHSVEIVMDDWRTRKQQEGVSE